jgi:hypothetical protein
MGGALVLFATAQGAGLQPDSVSYVSVARSLAAGQGFRMSCLCHPEPMTHYPPLYPLLLALPGLVGIDPYVAARWLGAGLFALNILAVGLIARAHVRHRGAALFAAALALLSMALLEDHVLAQSEGCLIFFLLASLGAFLDYWRAPRRGMLALSAVAMALAISARYAGLPFLGAFAVLVLLTPQPWRRRLADAAGFFLIGMSLFAAWIARNLLVARTAVHRPIALHVEGVGFVVGVAKALVGWVFPERAPWAAQAIVLAMLAVVLAVVIAQMARGRRASPDAGGGGLSSEGRLAVACVASSVAYVAFLFLSIALVDHSMPLDSRILSPIYPMLVLLVAAFLSKAFARIPAGALARRALVAMLAFLTLLQGARVARQAWHDRVTGEWYDVKRHLRSKLIELAKSLPPGVVIYTNDPAPIYFFAHRAREDMPYKYSPYSLEPNQDYDAQMRRLRDEVAAGRASVIYFERHMGYDSVPTVPADPAELEARWGLARAVQDDLGSAFVSVSGR